MRPSALARFSRTPYRPPMGMRSLAILAVLAGVSACGPAERPAPKPAAVAAPAPAPPLGLKQYGKICFYPKSGDVSGLLVSVATDAPKPTIGFKLCEGECREWSTTNASVSDKGIAFDTYEDVIDGRTRVRKRYRFTGVFEEGGLALQSVDDAGKPFFARQVLRPSEEDRCPASS